MSGNEKCEALNMECGELMLNDASGFSRLNRAYAGIILCMC